MVWHLIPLVMKAGSAHALKGLALVYGKKAVARTAIHHAYGAFAHHVSVERAAEDTSSLWLVADKSDGWSLTIKLSSDEENAIVVKSDDKGVEFNLNETVELLAKMLASAVAVPASVYVIVRPVLKACADIMTLRKDQLTIQIQKIDRQLKTLDLAQKNALSKIPSPQNDHAAPAVNIIKPSPDDFILLCDDMRSKIRRRS